MKKIEANTDPLSRQAKALQRMAKYYPEEYRNVKLLRRAHSCLYELSAVHFENVLLMALNELVRIGICKRPQRIKFNQR